MSDEEIVPGPMGNAVIRAGKLVGAVMGILTALVVVVSGIWQVGGMVDDLEDTKSDLNSLNESFREHQVNFQREKEIQREILINIRIAVASIQTVNGYQTSTSVRGTPIERPSPARPRELPVVTSTLSVPLNSPEVEALIQSLPPLPPQSATLSHLIQDDLLVPHARGTSLMPPSLVDAVILQESEMANVALQRAEMLQGNL